MQKMSSQNKKSLAKLDHIPSRNKLLGLLSKGFSVVSALNQVNISPATYYRYIKNNPEFVDEVENYKELHIGDIQKVINKGLKRGDYRFALEYLKYLRPQAKILVKADINEVYDRLDEIREDTQIQPLKVKSAKVKNV